MPRFVLASLTPAALLLTACLWGGVWPALAMGYMTVFVAVADRLGPEAMPRIEGAEAAANRLSVALGLAHLLLLPLGVRAIAAGPVLDPWGRVLTGLALGLFLGQVSHPNAHELIHRSARGLRRLGVAVYVTLLFGHHASAHPKVHHVHVATDRDPNSARLGEGVYRFFLRAWIGSFRAGLAAETAARARRVGGARGLHPYAIYLGGAAATLAAAGLLAGGRGVAVLLALCAYAQAQLLLADYVQHYGLRRALDGAGKPEPAGARHSWNAGHWLSSSMMLNAPRHSDHHQTPGRAFPALRLEPDRMPMLPRSMPVMAVIALIPPLWRRVMDRRARVWGVDNSAPGE